MTSHDWDAARYAQFRDERRQPALDLARAVKTPKPKRVVDFGCGDGAPTRFLRHLWPEAQIVGVDSSDTMLDAAAASDSTHSIDWVKGDVRSVDPRDLFDGETVDVIFSSALLQWVPDHLPLVCSWVDSLAPGGTLAITVPDNFDAPSHALMRQVAEEHSRADDLLAALTRPFVPNPTTYLNTLTEADASLDVRVWQTTFYHCLPKQHSEHPVLSWVRSTGLRPVLSTLTDIDERAAFLKPYEAALDVAYPTTSAGVVLPFTRTFVLASRIAG